MYDEATKRYENLAKKFDEYKEEAERREEKHLCEDCEHNK